MKFFASTVLAAVIASSSAFVANQPRGFAHRSIAASASSSTSSSTPTSLKSSSNSSYSYLGDDGTSQPVPSSLSGFTQPVPANQAKMTRTSEPLAEFERPVASEDIWKTLDTIRVEGGTLRTCSFEEGVERVEVFLKSNGRPINGEVELWQGHHNDPQRMKVYMEDAGERSFRCIMECPGSSNSISIRNVAGEEQPITAGLEADWGGAGSSASPADILKSISKPRTVQGGAVYALPFGPEVQAIQVMLCSDGRPMNARVELLQGPNNVKQSMEIYCENGSIRPMYVIMDSPGTGNQIRIVNTATMEYPVSACIEPYIVDEPRAEGTTGITWA
jgi:hypothetical protein